MSFSRLFIAVLLLILGAVAGIGIERFWLADEPAAAYETAIEHARKHLQPDYICPMHPDVVSPKPGSCPICGMDLVERDPPAEKENTGADAPEVSVSPGFIQNFGVRTAKVSRGPVERRIVALGRISRMPLPRVTDVTPGLAGIVVSMSDREIGDTVHEGDLLFSVDSPAWRSLQQQYLEALEQDDTARADQLRQRLLSLGLPAAALQRLEEKDQIVQTLEVRAPVDGTVVERRAWKDKAVEPATKVYTLGGMNNVPVVISLFEGQGAWIDPGQRVVFRLPTFPGKNFIGRVDRTDREINFSTRTLPVYASFRTADPRIRYGMLVESTIHASEREDALRIPREALIRTGAGDRVIVALGDGRFRPVTVETGLESGDYIEILSGLDTGDSVVVSGQFLIDSESSLTADFRRMEQGDHAAR